MSIAVKPYFQLVRLPNLFTAAADSLAGWLLVGGTFAHPVRWVPLMAASMTIYGAGIALNDWFDAEIDLRERPARPIPSGRVSRRFAGWLGSLLLALGPILAGMSGSPSSFVVALALAGCVLGYDAGLKKTLLGPEAMGACRGLNVLLGMSQAAAVGGPSGWLVAGSLALFVTGVTWISRSETSSGAIAGIASGLAIQEIALVGLLVSASQPGRFLSPESAHHSTILGLAVLLSAAGVVTLAAVRALRQPSPSVVQRAVKTGVLSLVWLNVGVVVAVRGPMPALAVAALWVPAFVLGRWLYST